MNSFVEALINMVCELIITPGSKKIVLKFHGDSIFCYIVISKIRVTLPMKYIVTISENKDNNKYMSSNNSNGI